MTDRFSTDNAYNDGFEDGSSGSTNDNPYDANNERAWFDEYEKGYSDGRASIGDGHDGAGWRWYW